MPEDSRPDKERISERGAVLRRALKQAFSFYDSHYYARQHESWEATQFGFVHYMELGWRRLRNPSLEFNTAWYLNTYPDVAVSGVNPLLHFVLHGREEGRQPVPIAQTPKPLGLAVLMSDDQKGDESVPERVAVHVHVYYEEEAAEIFQRLATILAPRTLLLVSVVSDQTAAFCKQVVALLMPKIRLACRIVPNRGRNVAPLLTGFDSELRSSDIVLHLHTKRSPNAGDVGKAWLRHLLDTLVLDKHYVSEILKTFHDDRALGFVFPATPDSLKHANTWGLNRDGVAALLEKLELGPRTVGVEPPLFPMGFMFWARVNALLPLMERLKLSDFPAEPLPIDGSLAHVIERSLSIVSVHTSTPGVQVVSPDPTVRPRPSLAVVETGPILVQCAIADEIRQTEILARSLPHIRHVLILIDRPPSTFTIRDLPFSQVQLVEWADIPEFESWAFVRPISVLARDAGLLFTSSLECRGVVVLAARGVFSRSRIQNAFNVTAPGRVAYVGHSDSMPVSNVSEEDVNSSRSLLFRCAGESDQASSHNEADGNGYWSHFRNGQRISLVDRLRFAWWRSCHDQIVDPYSDEMFWSLTGVGPRCLGEADSLPKSARSLWLRSPFPLCPGSEATDRGVPGPALEVRRPVLHHEGGFE